MPFRRRCSLTGSKKKPSADAGNHLFKLVYKSTSKKYWMRKSLSEAGIIHPRYCWWNETIAYLRLDCEKQLVWLSKWFTLDISSDTNRLPKCILHSLSAAAINSLLLACTRPEAARFPLCQSFSTASRVFMVIFSEWLYLWQADKPFSSPSRVETRVLSIKMTLRGTLTLLKRNPFMSQPQLLCIYS